MSKPTIVVSGPDKGGFFAWIMTKFIVAREGGIPVRLTASKYNALKRSGQSIQFDGLIVGGGSDIHPESYGKELSTLAEDEPTRSFREKFFSAIIYILRRLFSIKLSQLRIDRDRDEMETFLLTQAMKQNKPTLGICRGAQLINVTCGGTLFQTTRDFYTQVPHIKTIRPLKTIEVDPHSALFKLLQCQQCKVNSLHEQAVDQVGENLKVSARDRNGIVQAIEHTTLSYLIGVQWHPEYLPRFKNQRRLFSELIARARPRAEAS